MWGTHQRENADGERQQLAAGAYEGAEDVFVRREAERVAVDVLPARLLLIIACSATRATFQQRAASAPLAVTRPCEGSPLRQLRASPPAR